MSVSPVTRKNLVQMRLTSARIAGSSSVRIVPRNRVIGISLGNREVEMFEHGGDMISLLGLGLLVLACTVLSVLDLLGVF